MGKQAKRAWLAVIRGTVNTYVIDPGGSLARILPYGTSAADMLREVIKLLPFDGGLGPLPLDHRA